MYKFILAFCITFLCYIGKVQAQIITHSNYVSTFSKAQAYTNEGKYVESAKLHYTLLQFLEDNKQIVKDSIDVWRSKNYYSISRLYLFQEDSLSIKYADSTISAALRTKDPLLIQRGYSLKYYCLYDIKGKEKELNTLASLCIQYAKKTANNKILAESYMHKCNALVELGRGEESLAFCKKAENLFKTITEERYLASVYNNIANVFVKGNEIEKALEYYKKANELNIKQNNLQGYNTTTKNIAEKNKILGNYKIAAQYYETYSDSINKYYANLLDTNFAEAEAKYQTQIKDKEIAQQQLEIAKQKNTRNSWIIGSLVFILIGISLFQWRFTKQKRKKLLAENNYQKEQEINNLRTKFLGNIAHEIRTPLTLISGNLELAKDNILNKEKALQNIDVALTNSKKVVEDANEILELLKFEKNKTTIKLITVNLNQTLKRIFLSFNSLAKIKHINLDYQSKIPTNYTVKIDVGKVEKILNNLISNAIKYSSSVSKIIFNAEIVPVFDKDIFTNLLIIRVSDFGQGIYPNEAEKIFERFYQSTQSNVVGGIGIGLSLAKEFTELLGGNLKVESELSKGSTFTLTLPVSKTKETLDKKKAYKPESDSILKVIDANQKNLKQINDSKNKPKILVVEDNPEMCNYLVAILSEKYDCATAFDGIEALIKIKNNRFDLITSDIMMPKLSGFQLREKLNENEDLKNIPFILISAKTLEEDKIKGFNLGIDDYIVKPFNKNELIVRIDNLLINKKSRENWLLQQKNILVDSEPSYEKLLKKIEEIVIKNISDENFKITQISTQIGYSQRQLSRLLNQYIGMSPVKFILEIRLQKAYKLLVNKAFFTLSEVRYEVGIPTSSYFNRKFRERFGINPKELLS